MLREKARKYKRNLDNIRGLSANLVNEIKSIEDLLTKGVIKDVYRYKHIYFFFSLL